jgi:hypothetical protein
MSAIGTPSGSAGLPVTNREAEPAWVRNGSRTTQRTYETALAFEGTLVEELSRTLTQTSGLAGEGSQEGEPGSQDGASAPFSAQGAQLSALLPQALSEGVMRAGGLGLAAQLTRQQQALEAEPRPAQSGGAAAPRADGAR